MQKAFNSVHRTIPLKDLSNIIDNNKLNLVNLMLDTGLTVQRGNKDSESF